jgi:hypothetical protein
MIAARLSRGAISESNSSHLPPSEASKLMKPVVFPPGRLTRSTMPLATGSPPVPKDDRDRLRLPLEGGGRRSSVCQDDVGLRADQLLRERSYPIGVTAGPANVHPHVAAIDPTQVPERLSEGREAMLLLGIVFVERHKHADAPQAVPLLPPRRQRPSHHAEPSNEFAPSHLQSSRIKSGAVTNDNNDLARQVYATSG